MFAYYTHLYAMKYGNKSIKGSFYTKQAEFRKTPIEDLIGYLHNPGRFSVLVLGARGTGKTHWLNEISKENKQSDCLSGIISINGWIAKNADERYWEERFKEAENKLLVIDEVEELSKATQAILFEFLSTSNGKYGWSEKKYQCRIVFTSSYEIKTLRDSEEYLLHKFFDRISQLVVYFPSFTEKNGSIWNDFQATWTKMDFPESEMPDNNFKNWLESNSHKFHGNFRDLDKLAINWRNYLLKGVSKKDTLGKVSEDFFSLYHFPEHKSENQNAFFLHEDMDYYGDIQPKFKKFVKEFAKRKYGKLSKAPNGKPLGVPYRTMEGW
jgi:predicted AAA+ superfamily ATPase